MIDDLRFIERKDYNTLDGPYRIVKILQYSDGYTWFDVPLVVAPPTNPGGGE